MSGQIIADISISLFALVGLLILIFAIRHSEAASVSRRFLTGLYVIVLLLGARILFWLNDAWIFDALSLLAAAFVPLVVIVVTEGLLRRHAPPLVKLLGAGSAIMLVPLAFFPGSVVDPERMQLFFVLQLAAMIASGFLVIMRDKSTLSALENRVINRIALSLLLLMPFLITDFRLGNTDLPVRLGGIGILALCWLTISLERAHLNNQDMLRAFAMMFATAIVTSLLIGAIGNFDMIAKFQTGAIALASLLLVVIYNDAVALRFSKRRAGLLRHMSEGDISSSQAFLTGLQRHELVEGALILEEEELVDFDITLLRQGFEQNPVAKFSKPSHEKPSLKNEQIDYLFTRYEASHIILASSTPLVLVALNMPGLAASPGAEIELKAVQRMAFLISEVNAGKHRSKKIGNLSSG